MTPNLASLTPADLAGPLDDWGPRNGADTGSPMTSGRVLFEQDGIGVGIWECTAGGWSITDRADTETVHILSGRARLTNADGTSRDVVAGDVAVLPKGWSGRWDVLETVRKLYITVA